MIEIVSECNETTLDQTPSDPVAHDRPANRDGDDEDDPEHKMQNGRQLFKPARPKVMQ
jgi:hypothetical protein